MLSYNIIFFINQLTMYVFEFIMSSCVPCLPSNERCSSLRFNKFVGFSQLPIKMHTKKIVYYPRNKFTNIECTTKCTYKLTILVNVVDNERRFSIKNINS